MWCHSIDVKLEEPCRTAVYPKQRWSGGGRGFSNPAVATYGRTFGGANTHSYRSPGYGTRFGTSFPGGVGQYGASGFGRKSLGMGVGAGFVGGAGLGAAGTAATMGVYHRYLMFRMLTGGSYGHNSMYYNTYYHNNHCYQGCPLNSHCEWGFCECDRGFLKSSGLCINSYDFVHTAAYNPSAPDPCSDSTVCQKMDVNLICNSENHGNMHGYGGSCECRQDMRWNKE